VLSLLIMWFYPLTDKVFRQIVGEIAARRVERELAESPASDQRQ
jgi:Na+/melibiose symporter-like transporter